MLGNANPVAAPFFNFTVTEPMGIVGVIAPDATSAARAGVAGRAGDRGGNTVVALASETQPYPAIVLGEMLATSDLPGGVVNILTGFRHELVPTFASHTHIRGISAVVGAEERKELELGAAETVKRVKRRKAEEKLDWNSDSAQGVYEIRDFVEFKTTWLHGADVRALWSTEPFPLLYKKAEMGLRSILCAGILSENIAEIFRAPTSVRTMLGTMNRSKT